MGRLLVFVPDGGFGHLRTRLGFVEPCGLNLVARVAGMSSIMVNTEALSFMLVGLAI